MARISNIMITFLNLVTLVVSLCVICASLWLYVKVESPCEKALRTPLLIAGGALLVVSMVGLLGSCCAITFFMWIYLITLFLLIVGLTAFTLFAIVITHQGIGDALSGAGNTVGYHKLGEPSLWLQNHVVNEKNWEQIKSCMVKGNLCQIIEGGKDEDLYKQKLSTIQLGCCKPPNECSVEKKNSTVEDNLNCKLWSNDPTQLCFNCESCKKASLDNIKGEWRMLAIFNTCILITIIIIYSIGCCALRNI